MDIRKTKKLSFSDDASSEKVLSDENTSASSEKPAPSRISDLLLSVLRIAVFTVIMIWAVVPHKTVDGTGARCWTAPAYVVVSYNIQSVDCERVGIYPFPFNFMDADELWDKFEAERQGITMSEIHAKEYEMVTTRSSHWPWN